MRSLTFISAYFCNRGMFHEQQRVWADYPADLKPHVHAIVTDDCSPKAERLSTKQIIDTGIGSLRLNRTLEKRRWNWLFARNLGVQQAATEWVLVTDIDHVLPAETLRAILTDPLEPSYVYRFSRVDAPRPWPYALAECPPFKPHPNTWLMTKIMYDRIGGYDERLSGCYGTDGEFRDRVSATAQAVVMRADAMVRYPREVIADASTLPAVMTRKNDPANDRDLIGRREARARIKHWRPLRVTFPFERLC